LHDRPRTGARSGRIRALDGLRGLAVVAVVGFHAPLSGMRGGFLGVSAFFTLSGYLITALLLDERDRTGGVSLRAFWARRARRLLPAASLTLVGVLLYGATIATPHQLRALRGDVLAAIAETANWRFLFTGRSYAQLFQEPSPVLHFWSLAIEEQFYLAFPLLMLGVWRVARGRRIAVAALLAAGVSASVAASVVLGGAANHSRIYYGTDTRAAELLVGALLAVALHGHDLSALAGRARRSLAGAGAVALATMLWWWSAVDQSTAWLYRGGFALHAVLTAAVIVAARLPGPVGRALGWGPLETVGRWSYGVYLFHWPVFLWLSPARTGLDAVPLLGLRLAVTGALAAASYHLVEQPVLRGAPRVRRPRALVPASAAVLVAALLATTWSPPPPEVVLGTVESRGAQPTARLTALGAGDVPREGAAEPGRARPRRFALVRRARSARPLRVLVVGDSVGLTLGRGFELWAREHGDARVVNAGRIYCPLGRTLPAREGLVEARTEPCDWTEQWREHVRRFDPDVTVVLFTIWEGAPRRLPGPLGWRKPGDPALDRWQLAEYEAAADTLSARGGHLVWLNVPCGRDIPVDEEHGLWFVNQRTIPRLAASRPRVHPIDLDAQLCPGGRFRAGFGGVPNARPDGAHFSDAGARAVARWLMPIVLGERPAPPYRRS
jgi:peptidoglycan/LPS O-acetylase OafA/YrhL